MDEKAKHASQDEPVPDLRPVAATEPAALPDLPFRHATVVAARDRVREAAKDTVDVGMVAANAVTQGAPVDDSILLAQMRRSGRDFFTALDDLIRAAYDAGLHDHCAVADPFAVRA